MRSLEGPAHARGWRVVCVARPGYGDSSRRRGRCVVDGVDDTNAVLDELGVSSCLVAGGSGGGPHALACAARLERATAVLVISGIAPWDADGLDVTAGMSQENLVAFQKALEGEDALRQLLDAMVPSLRQVPAAQILESLARTLPAVDRELLTEELAEDMVEALQEGTRTGVDGWVDDALAFVRPWGFRVEDIVRPVSLWQGAEDPSVPVAHGRWLAAHVPGVRAHILDGEGHLSVSVGAVEHMLDEVLELQGS